MRLLMIKVADGAAGTPEEIIVDLRFIESIGMPTEGWLPYRMLREPDEDRPVEGLIRIPREADHITLQPIPPGESG